MAILLRFPKPSLLITKIAAVILSIAAVAFILSRFAVPYSITAAPLFWYSIRFVLSPPYLFITVHVIIVAIWKLSDQNPNGKPSTAVDEVDNRNATPLKTVTAESDAVTPGSAESCVTSVSEEEERAVSSRLEFEDEETEEVEGTWRELVMKKSTTWEKSSDTAAVAADVVSEIAGELTVKRSVTMKEMTAAGNDEMNRRFEAFIKKNYDQIRSY